MFTYFRRTSVILKALAGAFLLAVAVPVMSARAQFGGMMGWNGTESPLTQRSVNAYVKILTLDDVQRETAATLMEGYQEAYRNTMKEMQEEMTQAMGKAQEEGDRKAMQTKMREASERVQKKMNDLEEGYFNDLKGLLTDDQLKQWDRVERHRRRENTMRFPMMSGSGVDLFRVVERTRIPEAGIKDVLEEYERSLDLKLVDFEREGKSLQESALKDEDMFDWSNPQKAMAKVEEMMKKLADHARGVRDVNRSFSRRIVTSLSEDDARKFEEEVRLRSFPKIYKKPHAFKLISVAEGLNDLDQAQKDSLAALKSTYTREFEESSERWAQATEEQEEKLGGTVMVMMKSQMAFWGGGETGEKDPVAEAKKARKEIDDKAEERVKSILRAEQRDRLPKKETKGFENPWDPFGGLEEEEVEVATPK